MLEQHTDIFQEFPLLLPLSGMETLGAREGGSVVLGTSLIRKLLTRPPPLPPQLFFRLDPVQCRFNRHSS